MKVELEYVCTKKFLIFHQIVGLHSMQKHSASQYDSM